MNDPVAILSLDELNLEPSVQGLLTTSHGKEAACSLTGDAARTFLDILQTIIDGTQNRPLLLLCRKCSKKLCERLGVLPRSLFVGTIQRLGNHPVSGGGCADVWKGIYHGQTVALKVFRVFTINTLLSKLQKEFCQEALVWRQLKHPNITPFFGVSTDLFPPHMCMVSPWMVNGNILQYLEKDPNRDRAGLLYNIAEGIEYLHSMEPQVIHGDVRGANILINEELCPMLSDFGLAIVSDTQSATYGTDSLIKGSIRWMAPELFKLDLFEGVTGRWSVQTDIYAFACLAIEIYSCQPPFSDATEPSVILQVMEGKRPKPPGSGMPPKIWDLIQMCWAHQPSERPQMEKVVAILRRICHVLRLPRLLQLSLMESRFLLGTPGPLVKLGSRIWSSAISPDCRHVSSGSDDGIVRVWNTETGGSYELTGHAGGVNAVKFSPDSKQIALGSDDKTVRIWDTASAVTLRLTRHTSSVWSVTFLPDSKFVAFGSADYSICLWKVETGVVQLFTGHIDWVFSVAFSPDGKHIASCSGDKTVRIWDILTGVSRTLSGHTYWVRCVVWSPDGKYVASGSHDKTICLWHVNTGASRTFTGHGKTVRCLAFSLDGKHIVSGSYDNTVRIWHAETGNMVSGLFEGHTGEIRCITFSRCGKHVVSACSDGAVRAWVV